MNDLSLLDNMIPETQNPIRKEFVEIIGEIKRAYEKNMVSYVDSGLAKLWRLIEGNQHLFNPEDVERFKIFLDEAVADVWGLT